MWSIIAAVGGIGTILSLAVWAFRAYTAKKNAEAVALERQAGADNSELKASQDEIHRNEMAVTAGTDVDGVRNQFDNADRSKGK